MRRPVAEGGAAAAAAGARFERQVERVISSLGLDFVRQARMGVSIVGRKRITDFVVYDPTGRSLGIECKFQQSSGSAEDKLVHTIQDFDARPIKHIMVFGGAGFSKHFTGYLLSTGKAIEIEDLPNYLVFYFGLAEHFGHFAKRPGPRLPEL